MLSAGYPCFVSCLFLKVGGLLCTSLESAPFVVVIASSNWFWFLDHISAKSWWILWISHQGHTNFGSTSELTFDHVIIWEYKWHQSNRLLSSKMGIFSSNKLLNKYLIKRACCPFLIVHFWWRLHLKPVKMYRLWWLMVIVYGSLFEMLPVPPVDWIRAPVFVDQTGRVEECFCKE